MVSLTGFRYEKSTEAYLKQGVKNNRTPRGAVSGGNGTFLMAGDPPKVIFYISDNGNISTNNFYWTIKNNSSRRITERYCKSIFNNVESCTYASMEDLEKAIIANCI